MAQTYIIQHRQSYRYCNNAYKCNTWSSIDTKNGHKTILNNVIPGQVLTQGINIKIMSINIRHGQVLTKRIGIEVVSINIL